jgi:alkylation response protein AidB-like acyl-CoA dehydrogenase
LSTVSTSTSPTPDELAELAREIRAYVEDEGERWAERIEREREVPIELWEDLRDRGSRSSRCRTARCG